MNQPGGIGSTPREGPSHHSTRCLLARWGGARLPIHPGITRSRSGSSYISTLPERMIGHLRGGAMLSLDPLAYICAHEPLIWH